MTAQDLGGRAEVRFSVGEVEAGREILVAGGNVFGGVRAGGGVEGVQFFACITDSGEGVVEGGEHGAEFAVDGFAVAAELGVECAVDEVCIGSEGECCGGHGVLASLVKVCGQAAGVSLEISSGRNPLQWFSPATTTGACRYPRLMT